MGLGLWAESLWGYLSASKAKFCFRFFLFLLALSFLGAPNGLWAKDTAERRPSFKDRIYYSFWQRFHLTHGKASEHLERLDADPAARHQLNLSISGNPYLSEVAREGEDFREWFFRQLETQFDLSARALLLDPSRKIQSDFDGFLTDQRRTERPLPYHIAASRAYDEAFRSLGIPTQPRHHLHRLREGPAIEEMIKLRTWALQFQTEPALSRNPEVDPEELQDWKLRVSNEISQARLQILVSALRSVSKHEPISIYFFEVSGTTKTAPLKIELTPQVLDSLQFSLVPRGSNPVTHETSRFAWDWVESLRSRWWKFKWNLPIFSQGLRKYLKNPEGTFSKPEEEKKDPFVISIQRNENGPSELRKEMILSPISLEYFLWQSKMLLSKRASGGRLKEARRFIDFAIESDRRLSSYQEFLSPQRREDVESFQQRLKKQGLLEIENRRSDATQFTHFLGSDESQKPDKISGLYWRGYLESQGFWSGVDRVEKFPKRPGFLDLVKKQQDSLHQFVHERVDLMKSRLPKDVRAYLVGLSVYTATVLVAATLIFGKAAIYYEFGKGIGISEGQKQRGEDRIEFSSTTRAQNYSKSKFTETQETVLYEVSPRLGDNLAGIPTLFDTPSLEDLERLKHDRLISLNPEPQSENFDFQIQTKKKAMASKQGYVLVPKTERFELVGLELKLGKFSLKLGQDFHVYKDPFTNFLLIELSPLWRTDGQMQGLSYRAQYRHDALSPRRPNPNLGEMNSLALFPIVDELRDSRFPDGGFRYLAESLQTTIAFKQERGRAVTWDDIANSIRLSSYYTYRPASEEMGAPGNPFSPQTRFLRNGRICTQCNGAHETAANTLNHYFELAAENYEARPLQAYTRAGDSRYIRAISHVRTVVGEKNGRALRILDATPEELAPGEKPMEKPFESSQTIDPDLLLTAMPPKPLRHEAAPKGTEPFEEVYHKTRIQRLADLRSAFAKNFFVRRSLRLSVNDSSPAENLARLARVLESYSLGSLPFSDLVNAITKIYPRWHPAVEITEANLSEALKDLHTHALQILQALKKAALRNPKYSIFANEGFADAVQDYFKFIIQTNWAPKDQLAPADERAFFTLKCAETLEQVAIASSPNAARRGL
jgi:hypothetical protein